MRIKIKNLKGQIIPVTIQPSDCIIDIKKVIANTKGLPVEKQKLIYKGKNLQNNVLVAQIDIKEGEQLLLMTIILNNHQKIQKQVNQTIDKKKLDPRKEQQKEEKQLNKQDSDSQNSQKRLQILKKKLKKKTYDPSSVGLRNMQNQQQKQESQIDPQKRLQILNQKIKKKSFNPSSVLNSQSQKKKIRVSQKLREQILEAVYNNQQVVNQNGQIKTATIDVQQIINALLTTNQQFQKIIKENPDCGEQLIIDIIKAYEESDGSQFDLEQGEEEQEEQSEWFDQFSSSKQKQQQQKVEVPNTVFSEVEERAIQNLMVLGFKREQVISTYVACLKNQEMTANLLLNEQQNQELKKNDKNKKNEQKRKNDQQRK